jgi:hypothetical protein
MLVIRVIVLFFLLSCVKGQYYTYTVPGATTSLTVNACGAKGLCKSGITTGGKGGCIVSQIAVTPGQAVYVYVGVAGGGGLGSGGLGSAVGYSDGGGASDIRTSVGDLTSRKVVGGGGGGCGHDVSQYGGAGGGLQGGDGGYGGSSTAAGKGGSQVAGGAGGVYGGNTAGSGGLGTGGNGVGIFGVAGGGGAGYYGGGGGIDGGAGGSSYSVGTILVNNQGVNDGDGYVEIISPSYQKFSKFVAVPSSQPTGQPSGQPISRPTGQPSGQPTLQPVSRPTGQPSGQPSGQPISRPTGQPSGQPSDQPISRPSGEPSGRPSGRPSAVPSSLPTNPTGAPSSGPSGEPSCRPSAVPSFLPTNPTGAPSSGPSDAPSSGPSGEPSGRPSAVPSSLPTNPTGAPSSAPSDAPSSGPSGEPSGRPSAVPSSLPTNPTGAPSSRPISQPTSQPSFRSKAFTPLIGQLGQKGDEGDGGSASEVKVRSPWGIWSDDQGKVFFSDSQAHTIRVLSSNNVDLLAGHPGISGAAADIPSAISAYFSRPQGISGDSALRKLWICDTVNHVVREIDLSTAPYAITTIAGTNNVEGYAGDGGLASSAKLHAPIAIYYDKNTKNKYIAEVHRCTIRMIDGQTNLISTIAGVMGSCGFNGDGPALSSTLFKPFSLFMDTSGHNLLIADFGNNRIRSLNLQTHTLSTVAGGGVDGFEDGDRELATSAYIASPSGVWVDHSNNIFISESNGHRVREINADDGKIYNIVGLPGRKATADSLWHPRGVWGDESTNQLFVSDSLNRRIVSFALPHHVRGLTGNLRRRT